MSTEQKAIETPLYQLVFRDEQSTRTHLLLESQIGEYLCGMKLEFVDGRTARIVDTGHPEYPLPERGSREWHDQDMGMLDQIATMLNDILGMEYMSEDYTINNLYN